MSKILLQCDTAVDPTSAVVKPSAHGEQEVCPCNSVYDPISQGVQAAGVPDELVYVPASHCVHDVPSPK